MQGLRGTDKNNNNDNSNIHVYTGETTLSVQGSTVINKDPVEIKMQ